MSARRRGSLVALATLLAAPLAAQRAPDARGLAGRTSRASDQRYDDAFRKYTKRFFGPAFDWHYFKAQGMAESDLMPNAVSRVGARGVMQLMPSTFKLIKTARPEFASIDDPEWNIAAGIMHDRDLWMEWKDPRTDDERAAFMFGSYNAGEGPIMRARGMARAQQLDHREWRSIESVAPKVERWRYKETVDYVKKIKSNHDALGANSRWLLVEPDKTVARP
ncbi:MAG: transglycosylase SLT domain-containing protein [Gemmatimonadota bacterium]|nr:transglycosylase SLT domain-containing protein [Gemmatimonadota bacterium]